METQNNTIQGSGYGNVYIDSLVWGSGWRGTGPITYWFAEGDTGSGRSEIGRFTGASWTATEKAAFLDAVAQYAAVCNVTFQQASSQADANMVWWLAPESRMGVGSLGMHEVPDGTHPQLWGYFNRDDSSWSNLARGSSGFVTVIHELGHGMGLAHPHDGGDHADWTKFPGVKGAFTTGQYGLNQGIWTVMSYNDGWAGAPHTLNSGNQGTLMAFDIAALHAIYGANLTTHTGADVYSLPTNATGAAWSCIWDAGGNDTISNAGSSVGAVINLNDAPLTGANAGGYISRVGSLSGGFTIAHGAIIENAVGGSGNDSLIGNAAANVLDGGTGVDTLKGGGGDDTYIVDSAADVVVETFGMGNDTITALVDFTLPANVENLVMGGNAALTATGNNLANLLVGNGAADVILGGAGADTIDGGAGADVLTGGRDADVFRFLPGDTGVGAGARDVITDFSARGGDRIDLRGWDANSNVAGVQSFSYIGKNAFTGNAGELHFVAGVLSGDLNGDKLPDFEIELTGVAKLTAAAFVA